MNLPSQIFNKSTALLTGFLLWFISFVAAQPQALVRLEYTGPSLEVERIFPEWKISADNLQEGCTTVALDEWTEGVFEKLGKKELDFAYDFIRDGKFIDELLSISQNRVLIDIMLVDDYGLLENDPNSILTLAPYRGAKSSTKRYYALPSHEITEYPGEQKGTYLTWVTIGGKYLKDAMEKFEKSTNDFQAIEAVLARTIFRAQFPDASTKYGSASQRTFKHELTGDRIFREQLWVNPQTALFEGLATYYSFCLYDMGWNELGNWYENQDYRYFIPVAGPLSYKKELVEATDIQDGKIGSHEIWEYKWKDLPAQYLLHSESTIAAFFSYFTFGNGVPSAMTFKQKARRGLINEYAREVWADKSKRNLPYAVCHLALQLEEIASSKKAREKWAEVDEVLPSSMFPFAIFDLLTHFGYSDLEFQRVFTDILPSPEPQAYQKYLASYRDPVWQMIHRDLIEEDSFDFYQAYEKIEDFFEKEETILVKPK